MFELKILTRFAAAHQLTMVGTKCENLHGHNWKIEVCVTGEKLDSAGIVMDFGILKKYVSEIIDTIDHKFLNEHPGFAGKQPSSENIAIYIADSLKSKIGDQPVKVSAVHAWESDDACATYIPE
jgi:6-pyruvoyltetrahydropterin/6-carboxytetrahydropterin synthase